MPPRQRVPTALELALWRHVMRDVRPLAEEAAGPSPPGDAAPPVMPPDIAPPSPPAASSKRVPVTRASPIPGQHNLDRRSWQRLQRGQYPISARLDLHGLTQTEAHDRLVRFMGAQQIRGARCVLVITGVGARSGGVLRSLTPRWLETPPLSAKVLAFAPARLSHGGEGALYVLLRRPRERARA